jgi:hypothetical protein
MLIMLKKIQKKNTAPKTLYTIHRLPYLAFFSITFQRTPPEFLPNFLAVPRQTIHASYLALLLCF